MKKLILTGVCVMFAASVALADWNPGDGHKMHHPQLPDPQGWDVNFVQPKVLADDWRCSQSGPVEDIHFWFSSRGDEPFELLNIHVSIHDDVPAGADANGGYSHPGNLLWERDFDPNQFTVRDWGSGEQGWYNPNTGEAYPLDHQMIFQANITDIPDPFIQKEGTIYWLDLSVVGIGPLGEAQLGWKTSRDHFLDDAVWTDAGSAVGWNELRDPFTGESLDMAFVITPEPATLSVLILGAMSILARKRRRRTD